MRELLGAELAEQEGRRAESAEAIRELLLPRDPNEGRNAIVEIQGAEGGEEANLWAGDLARMYARYADRHGLKIEVLATQPSEQGGLRDMTFVVKGEEAWRRFRYEGGPHRVQRVPATEAQGRIHTSAATVAVLPEADEVDVEVDPADLEIDVYRATGPGGQSVNTTDSAVRITHRPTGLVVTCQDEKSQLQNKEKAMRILRARLLRAEQERQQAEIGAARREQVRGGGRSEKIRTYNYKENRVTDHRIGLTLHALDRVLDGELDEIVDAAHSHDSAFKAVEVVRAGGQGEPAEERDEEENGHALSDGAAGAALQDLAGGRHELGDVGRIGCNASIATRQPVKLRAKISQPAAGPISLHGSRDRKSTRLNSSHRT